MKTFFSWINESAGDNRKQLIDSLIAVINTGDKEKIDEAFANLRNYFRSNGMFAFEEYLLSIYKNLDNATYRNFFPPEDRLKLISGDVSNIPMITLNSHIPLSRKEAEELSKFNGNMFSINSKSITTEVAEIIGKINCSILSLEGLIYLDPESAEKLVQTKARTLGLGIKKLDTDTARVLSNFQGSSIDCNYLQEIDPETAREIAKWKFDVIIGLVSITPEVAKELKEYQGELMILGNLPKRKDLPPEIKKHLGKKKNIRFAFSS